MFIFRRTFINILIPLSLFLVGGPILFFMFRKKIKYYVDNELGIFPQVFHGTVLFGGVFMFVFMFLNYYLPVNKTELYDLRVVETGYLSNRRSCDPPFALVDYYGFKKQLVFPCKTKIGNTKSIKVKLQKGLFGFLIVKNLRLDNSAQTKS